MYNTDAMGVRIGELRRAKGLTQEAFAKTLGISAQAVSKWETGLGFPDISLLPMIAETLGTKIETLFGAEPTPPPTPEKIYITAPETPPEIAFPETAGNLRIVHCYGTAACYADADPVRIDGARVTFSDGSTADLAEGEIVNNSGVRVKIEYADEDAYQRYRDPSAAFSYDYSGIRSLDVRTSGAVETEIHSSDDGVTRVEASGSERFLDSLRVEQRGGTLEVINKSYSGGGVYREHNNRIRIYAGFCRGEDCTLSIAGSGQMNCEPDFQHVNASIAGSGDIRFAHASTVEAAISGSGVIIFDEARVATMKIAGSGDITANAVRETAVCGISGSGDITLGDGELQRLEASISGSGDLRAGNLNANEVEISISGAGDVKLGHGTARRLSVSMIGAGEVNAEGVTAETAEIRLQDGSTLTVGAITGRSVERVAKTATLRVLSHE